METKLLTPREAPRAARLLRQGGTVAIPTETVYGLGANGLDPRAVARIFVAKGRPQDNPLILHIPSADWLERFCDPIPPAAVLLARTFWPGPLTLILRRKPIVPDAVTAGLDTVGIRCPDCPVTRRIIRLAGCPVAAPSANTSGKPSPTTARHVLDDMDGRIDAVVDGGPCRVGVESTILDLTVSPPRLLRPGGVTLEELEALLGPVEVDPAVTRLMAAGERPRAPGMKYRHYAPRAPVTVLRGAPDDTADWLRENLPAQAGVICFSQYVHSFPGHPVEDLGPSDQPQVQARRLFDALRAFDRLEVPAIYAQSPSQAGIGLAINNRLSKAAGFHIITIQGKEDAPC